MVETVLWMTDLQIRALTAVGQLGIAGAVGVIAYRQWQTARNKLRSDLFDRRYTLYKEINQKVVDTLGHKGIHKELELLAPLAEARWLFGHAIADFVNDHLYVPLVDLTEARETRRELGRVQPIPANLQAEYQAAVKAANEIRKRVYKNLNEFRRKMDDYLVLQH